MNYAKPEITPLASASSMIQGLPKAAATTPDGSLVPDRMTVAAYESDE
jgi:hypothetical protein